MDNIRKTREYFDRNFQALRRVKRARQGDIARAVYGSLEGKLSGVVLDIGGGGACDYPVGGIERIISLDSSRRSIEDAEKKAGVEFVAADALSIGMKTGVFDRVVILHTLHHLAGESVADTRKNISSVIREAYRVLKRGGKVMIVDAFMGSKAQKTQEALFPLLRLVFALCGKPMVHYFSLGALKEMMAGAGFGDMRSTALETGNAIMTPFSLSIGIPFKYTPLSHMLVEGVKR